MLKRAGPKTILVNFAPRRVICLSYIIMSDDRLQNAREALDSELGETKN